MVDVSKDVIVLLDKLSDYRRSLEVIRGRLAGIDPDDLTTAETQILEIVNQALEAQQ